MLLLSRGIKASCLLPNWQNCCMRLSTHLGSSPSLRKPHPNCLRAPMNRFKKRNTNDFAKNPSSFWQRSGIAKLYCARNRAPACFLGRATRWRTQPSLGLLSNGLNRLVWPRTKCLRMLLLNSIGKLASAILDWNLWHGFRPSKFAQVARPFKTSCMQWHCLLRLQRWQAIQFQLSSTIQPWFLRARRFWEQA